MLGELLDGRYKVIRTLSAGGFGQTFVAEDTKRPGNPVCVVKQLKPASSDLGFLESARRMFNSEAETLEVLGDHPQIPRLLAYVEQDQEFYLMQEYIEGRPLSTELSPGTKWTEDQVTDFLKEVLGILSFVHQKGVIHRDVKPDNIIRRRTDNKFVLVDFGAVKQLRTQTTTGQGLMSATIAIGTPGYMPSEQGIGKPKPSSDIYALGVIAIQALTGLHPSPDQEDTDTGFRYNQNTGEIIWQNKAEVSLGLGTVLTKMVKPHFPDRYASASEVLQALEQMEFGYTPTIQASSQVYNPTVPARPAERATNIPPPTQAGTKHERTFTINQSEAPTTPQVGRDSKLSRALVIFGGGLASLTMAIIFFALPKYLSLTPSSNTANNAPSPSTSTNTSNIGTSSSKSNTGTSNSTTSSGTPSTTSGSKSSAGTSNSTTSSGTPSTTSGSKSNSSTSNSTSNIGTSNSTTSSSTSNNTSNIGTSNNTTNSSTSNSTSNVDTSSNTSHQTQGKCPGTYSPIPFKNVTAKVAFYNEWSEPVTVVLYHPNGGEGVLFNRYTVNPGVNSILDNSSFFGDDWGVCFENIPGATGSVNNLGLIADYNPNWEGSPLFMVQNPRITR